MQFDNPALIAGAAARIFLAQKTCIEYPSAFGFIPCSVRGTAFERQGYGEQYHRYQQEADQFFYGYYPVHVIHNV